MKTSQPEGVCVCVCRRGVLKSYTYIVYLQNQFLIYVRLYISIYISIFTSTSMYVSLTSYVSFYKLGLSFNQFVHLIGFQIYWHEVRFIFLQYHFTVSRTYSVAHLFLSWHWKFIFSVLIPILLGIYKVY